MGRATRHRRRGVGHEKDGRDPGRGHGVTRLNAKILKSLEGTEHTLGGLTVRFERSSNHLPAARQGGEGYAAPVATSQGERYMLKTYHLPTIERKQRITFLSRLELRDLLPVFEAVPSAVIDDALTTPDGTSVAVAGYVAPFVDGETVEGLLNEGWDPPLPARLRLAAQLCSAVEVLESGGLAHADLSMSNVMIIDAGAAVPELRFIDFDGFHHADVPTVPCSDERGGRGFGQDGYRHRVYQAMDDTVTVTSDRCAMAALVFELVVLRGDDAGKLGRSTVLEQRDIAGGAVSAPAPIVARWREGWSMLERAFAAPRPENAPAPAEWYEAIVRFATQAPHRSTPASRPGAAANGAGVVVALRLVEDGIERRVNLRGAGNSFASVSPRLAWLSYARSDAGVTLHGHTKDPVFVRRGGRLSRHREDIAIVIEPGDEIKWSDFEIQVG